MPKFSVALGALALYGGSVDAIDNGLGRTPPMGWRSWNCYHQAISQVKMTIAANAMVNKSRGVSLLDAGYVNCGLDDFYQKCKAGPQGSFHNASGYPIIDLVKFPGSSPLKRTASFICSPNPSPSDMKAMTDHAHSIGLKMGWYGNNCGCSETKNVPSWGANQTKGKTDGLHHYEGDIQATIDFGFDGIKVRRVQCLGNVWVECVCSAQAVRFP